MKDNNIIEMSAQDLKKYKLIKEGEFLPGDLVLIENNRYAKLEGSLLTKKAKFKIIDNVVYRKL
jgi:hypothetical protein